MNLKETIISSFFVHLILCLLIIAASHYTTGFPGGIEKIISVKLAMEDGKDQPAAPSASEDELRLASSPPSVEQSLPDQAVIAPQEESGKNPGTEKKAEATDEPEHHDKIERPSIQREGFSSLEAYYQFIAVHKKVFGQQAGVKINRLLGEAFKANKREFYGGVALASLTFGPDGRLIDFHVDSASPALKEFLEEIGWGAIPAPSAYSLGFTRVQIQFTVHEGYMSFTINVLWCIPNETTKTPGIPWGSGLHHALIALG